VSDEVVKIMLANGEILHVYLTPEEGCSPGAYSIRIGSDRGRMLVLPRADNSITVTTERAYKKMAAETEKALSARDFCVLQKKAKP
jgi:hypothetical protein